MGTGTAFGRSDVAAITHDSVTAAGNLINKLKDAGLLEAVSGYGKGKYNHVFSFLALISSKRAQSGYLDRWR